MRIPWNYRVIVQVDGEMRTPSVKSAEWFKRDAEKLAYRIPAALDDVLSAVVEYDLICSSCHEIWDVDDDGCPACCDKAVDEWALTRPPQEARCDGRDCGGMEDE